MIDGPLEQARIAFFKRRRRAHFVALSLGACLPAHTLGSSKEWPGIPRPTSRPPRYVTKGFEKFKAALQPENRT